MLISIKGMQIGDHEIKWVNFAEDTTIVLRDITYLNRIKVILKLYEDASSSKINFSKLKPGAYKNRTDQQDKWNRPNFVLNCLGLILIILSSITSIGKK